VRQGADHVAREDSVFVLSGEHGRGLLGDEEVARFFAQQAGLAILGKKMSFAKIQKKMEERADERVGSSEGKK
jgi:hypothetical protein